MQSVCKDFKRDLANVNFRMGSNSKVLNDGFNRLIEFHGFRVVCTILYLCRVCLSRHFAGIIFHQNWEEACGRIIFRSGPKCRTK